MTCNPAIIALCRREGLAFNGERSACLAVCLFRCQRRFRNRVAAGRSPLRIIGRVKAISRAYLNAMEADLTPTP